MGNGESQENKSYPKLRSKSKNEMRFQGTELEHVGKTKKAEGEPNAQSKSGAATVAARAFEGLLGLFKGHREEWTGQRHGALCARLRHLHIKCL